MIPKKYKELVSIKEAFDDLPCGTAFFDRNGMPLLVNKRMYDLIYDIEGKELQLLSDLDNILADVFVTISDGTVWRFERSAPKNNAEMIEIIAVDVTELYDRKLQLEKTNEEQHENVKRMEHINRNVLEITRNEEIIAMKMNIHGKLGGAVGMSKQFVDAGCPIRDKQRYVDMQRQTVKMLLGEIGHNDETDVFDELMSNAEILGMKISFEGMMPSGNISKNMLCSAARECLMNTIRHADGSEIFIRLDGNTAVITNNGKPPLSEITEGGGLTSLRRKIEKNGGAIRIEAQPVFRMTITLPISKKGEII